jgi:hypothetical protein
MSLQSYHSNYYWDNQLTHYKAIKLNSRENGLYIIESQLIGRLIDINKKSADFTALSKKNGGPTQSVSLLIFFLCFLQNFSKSNGKTLREGNFPVKTY